MRDTVCAICKTRNNSIEIYSSKLEGRQIDCDVFSARRKSEKGRLHYRIVRCKNCGLYRSDPILDSSKLKELYHGSGFTYGKEVENLKETYGKYIQNILLEPAARENYLDVGCGNGFMLEKAKELGFKNVFGVEPGEKAVALARFDIKPQIRLGFFSQGMYQENFFDLITVFQTLDHLENPKIFLEDCRKILKPGGAVLLINHDLKAPLNRLFGRRSPIVDIEHTYLFSQRTQTLLLQKCGYRLIQVFSVKNTFSIEYLVQLMPIGNKAKEILIKIVNFLKLNDIKVKLKLGNLGIIAKK